MVAWQTVMAARSANVNYYAYIRSLEWRAKADAAKRRAGYRCLVCNRPSSQVVLNAHHRTYERLGNEIPEDITVLCEDCHKLYERNKRIPKTRGAADAVSVAPSKALRRRSRAKRGVVRLDTSGDLVRFAVSLAALAYLGWVMGVFHVSNSPSDIDTELGLYQPVHRRV